MSCLDILLIKTSTKYQISPFYVKFKSSPTKQSHKITLTINDTLLTQHMLLPVSERFIFFEYNVSSFCDKYKINRNDLGDNYSAKKFNEVMKGNSSNSGSFRNKMLKKISYSRYPKELLVPNEEFIDQVVKLSDKKKKKYLDIVFTNVVNKEKANGRIFIYDGEKTKFIISDIDATITNSNVNGVVTNYLPKVMENKNLMKKLIWPGIVKLYNVLESRGYRILYLTHRMINFDYRTKFFLFESISCDKYSTKKDEKALYLPVGPLILTMNKVSDSLTTYFLKGEEMFKTVNLQIIKDLFSEAGHNPYYAGFGNNLRDRKAYVSVKTKYNFIINPSNGKIDVTEKNMEKDDERVNDLETFDKGYDDILKNIDKYFPDLNAAVDDIRL